MIVDQLASLHDKVDTVLELKESVMNLKVQTTAIWIVIFTTTCGLITLLLNEVMKNG